MRALHGAGLEGDRYRRHEGWAPRGTAITLVEAEAVEAIAEEHGIHLPPGGTRRNVVTRGIRLNDLVGREFTVAGIGTGFEGTIGLRLVNRAGKVIATGFATSTGGMALIGEFSATLKVKDPPRAIRAWARVLELSPRDRGALEQPGQALDASRGVGVLARVAEQQRRRDAAVAQLGREGLERRGRLSAAEERLEGGTLASFDALRKMNFFLVGQNPAAG